jgi:hypothetical protein
LEKIMLAQTDFERRAHCGWRERIADLIIHTIAHVRDKRQRAAWRREILALDDRQLRDAGISVGHVGTTTAARAAVRLANLNALR